MDLLRRVLTAYGRVHPSMYQHMIWRISEENAETIAKSLELTSHVGTGMPNHMFGMPVEFVEGDEILLVLVA